MKTIRAKFCEYIIEDDMVYAFHDVDIPATVFSNKSIAIKFAADFEINTLRKMRRETGIDVKCCAFFIKNGRQGKIFFLIDENVKNRDFIRHRMTEIIQDFVEIDTQ